MTERFRRLSSHRRLSLWFWLFAAAQLTALLAFALRG